MEVIFNGDLLVMKIKITYSILSPLVICYFRPILIFDLDHFFGDLPYLWFRVGFSVLVYYGKRANISWIGKNIAIT